VNRIRFTDGVARRGRLKDFKVPDIDINAGAHLPTTTTFPAVIWSNGKKRGMKRKNEVEERDVTAAKDAVERGQIAPADSPDFSPDVTSDQGLSINLEEDVEEIVRTDHRVLQRYPDYNNLQPWITPVDAGTRLLFSYFSDIIAPVMVVLDTGSNGYREIILPMALEDDVLRRAVRIVAAQHLGRSVPHVRDAVEASRGTVISHLRQQSLCATEDQVFNKFTWATLIVLLVGETVTGSPTCGFLINMLLCLAENSRTRNEGSDVARFLQTQTNMQVQNH